MLGERNIRQSIKAVSDPLEVAGANVVVEMGVFIAKLRRLLGGEVTRLALGQGGEFPVGGLSGAVFHVHTTSNILKYYAMTPGPKTSTFAGCLGRKCRCRR